MTPKCSVVNCEKEADMGIDHKGLDLAFCFDHYKHLVDKT